MALNIQVILKGVADPFIQSLRAASQAMERFERDTRETFEAVEKAAIASGAGFVAIAGAIGVAAKAFGDFEAKLNQVAAVSGATADEMKQISDAAIKIGAATQFSVTQAAEAFAELTKAGLSASQSLEAMPGIVSAAAAAGIQLGEAAGTVIATVQGFGLAMNETQRVADLLAQTANASSVDVRDLAESFKYVAPVAASAGQSIEEVSTALGILGNNGIKGSQAGTSLNGMLLRLLNPSKEAAKYLKAIGLEVEGAGGKMKPLTQLVKELADATGKYKQTAQGKIFAEVFGQEALPGVQALVNTVRKTPEAFAAMERAIKSAQGAADRMAEKNNKGLNYSINQLLGSLDSAKVTFGEQLAPAIISIAEGIKGLVDAFNALDPGTKKVLANLTLLAAGVLGGIAAIAGFILSFKAIGLAFVASRAALVPLIAAIKTGLLSALSATIVSFSGVGSIMSRVATGGMFLMRGAVLSLLNPLALAAAAVYALITAWREWENLKFERENEQKGQETEAQNNYLSQQNKIRRAETAREKLKRGEKLTKEEAADLKEVDSRGLTDKQKAAQKAALEATRLELIKRKTPPPDPNKGGVDAPNVDTKSDSTAKQKAEEAAEFREQLARNEREAAKQRYQEQLDDLKQALDENKITLTEYYRQRAEISDRALSEEVAAQKAVIAQTKAGTKERASAEAELVKILHDATRQRTKDYGEERKAWEDFADSFADKAKEYADARKAIEPQRQTSIDNLTASIAGQVSGKFAGIDKADFAKGFRGQAEAFYNDLERMTAAYNEQVRKLGNNPAGMEKAKQEYLKAMQERGRLLLSEAEKQATDQVDAERAARKREYPKILAAELAAQEAIADIDRTANERFEKGLEEELAALREQKVSEETIEKYAAAKRKQYSLETTREIADSLLSVLGGAYEEMARIMEDSGNKGGSAFASALSKGTAIAQDAIRIAGGDITAVFSMAVNILAALDNLFDLSGKKQREAMRQRTADILTMRDAVRGLQEAEADAGKRKKSDVRATRRQELLSERDALTLAVNRGQTNAYGGKLLGSGDLGPAGYARLAEINEELLGLDEADRKEGSADRLKGLKDDLASVRRDFDGAKARIEDRVDKGELTPEQAVVELKKLGEQFKPLFDQVLVDALGSGLEASDYSVFWQQYQEDVTALDEKGIKEREKQAKESIKRTLKERLEAEKEWTEGARDEAGRRISQEQKLENDLEAVRVQKEEDDARRQKQREKLQEDFRKKEEEDTKRIAKLREDIAKSQKAEEKEILDILAEGLPIRQKSVEQDKTDRIAAVREKGAEERRGLQDQIDGIQEAARERRTSHQEALDQLDAEQVKADKVHQNTLLRLKNEFQERLAAHRKRMSLLDEEISKQNTILGLTKEQLQNLTAIAALEGNRGGRAEGTSGIGGNIIDGYADKPGGRTKVALAGGSMSDLSLDRAYFPKGLAIGDPVYDGFGGPYVGQVVGFFSKGGIVPGDEPGDRFPAMLAKKEMVLPADIAQGLLAMIRSGGAAAVTNVFHFPNLIVRDRGDMRELVDMIEDRLGLRYRLRGNGSLA